MMLQSPEFDYFHNPSRTLDYHPHVHYVVPGGGLTADAQKWLPSHAHFFVPVRALSILYRAKFRDALARAGVLAQVDSAVWRQAWVVHSQAVGDGRASLKYLAPWVVENQATATKGIPSGFVSSFDLFSVPVVAFEA